MNSILIKNLSRKTTREILTGCLYPYNPILKIELLNDGENILARVELENETKAKQVYNDMNTKYILDNQITIEIIKSNDLVDKKKEHIAEIVYPIANDMYKPHAPKITGMMIDAILKNTQNDDELLNDLLSDDLILHELIDIAHDKIYLQSNIL